MENVAVAAVVAAAVVAELGFSKNLLRSLDMSAFIFIPNSLEHKEL